MSPDFNVLDLGFFNAIQSQVLDKTFMTLQKVMEEAFKLEGDNVYKLPHLKKDMQLKSETVENSGIETSMR
ncbi:hypothetical protein H257_18202 [Aphanomyces astaci]|uniref:Uncharacterized protein n=1 Tax=Aphanomyces astaci TaxID=112090 RepID=W4FE29_APHAT|nr:hypothetical protein H257_18202 [Aphanomyces astaci]ETV64993.1 hypothetical protein H257_18202 [Aphanomyces astaci]|eukprot:XP_009845518.1 hypothetical protein H257_18202 [Aphanomyces astaci]